MDQTKFNKSIPPKFDIAPKLITFIPTTFIPTTADINWYELLKDFTSFANQLCYKAKQSQSISIEPSKSINNHHQHDMQDMRLYIKLEKQTSNVWSYLLKT